MSHALEDLSLLEYRCSIAVGCEAWRHAPEAFVFLTVALRMTVAAVVNSCEGMQAVYSTIR